MKKIIAFVAFAAALAAFASYPEPGVSRQAATEPTEMLALQPAPKSLRIEGWDAI